MKDSCEKKQQPGEGSILCRPKSAFLLAYFSSLPFITLGQF